MKLQEFLEKNNEGIKTEEELRSMLKRYRMVMPLDILSYLDTLVGLETSVIGKSKKISDVDRMVLGEFSIYR